MIGVFDVEIDICALRSSDPVALHGNYLRGPVALQSVKIIEQSVCVIGDLEIPLGKSLLGDT